MIVIINELISVMILHRTEKFGLQVSIRFAEILLQI